LARRYAASLSEAKKRMTLISPESRVRQKQMS
jgi:hypothetical protein